MVFRLLAAIGKNGSGIRRVAFVAFVCLAPFWTYVIPKAACEVIYISECVMEQPDWFMDYELLCEEGCDPPEVPQQDPFQGGYWTYGCGGGKLIWKTWVYCVAGQIGG